MKIRVLIASTLAAIAMVCGLGMGVSPASAHGNDGRVNIVYNSSQSAGAIGVLNYWSERPNWSFLVNRGWNSTNFTTDVDGFTAGPGTCVEIRQSNDGVNYGYYGVLKGPFSFQTTYWLHTKVRWWSLGGWTNC